MWNQCEMEKTEQKARMCQRWRICSCILVHYFFGSAKYVSLDFLGSLRRRCDEEAMMQKKAELKERERERERVSECV